jgi:putative redox protein
MGGLRTRAIHLKSGNEILTDAPVDNQGKGEAFSPTDLLATSLLSCMLTIIGIQAQNRNLMIGKVSGTVRKIMAENPRRVARIEISILFENHHLELEHQRQLEHAALNCPVAKSLDPKIEQVVKLNF